MNPIWILIKLMIWSLWIFIFFLDNNFFSQAAYGFFFKNVVEIGDDYFILWVKIRKQKNSAFLWFSEHVLSIDVHFLKGCFRNMH